MEGSTAPPRRRTVTPAILLSAVFVASCAVFAVAFVAARGGLQMPVAPSLPPVAVATDGPSAEPSPVATVPPVTAAPTPPEATPTAAPPTLVPPTVSPPTAAPSAGPTLPIPTLFPNDPLAVLPGCPGLPGCFVYIVERGDSLTTIADKFLVGTTIILALNPQITDPSVVVTNSTMYLGRGVFVRLEPCPDGELCWLYSVRAGENLGDIASRYGLTTEAILAANADLPRPITQGQVIKLPPPPG